MLSLSVVHVIFLFSIAEPPEDAGDIGGDCFDPLLFFGPVRRVEEYVEERVESLFLTEPLFYVDLLPRFRWVLAFTESVLCKSRYKCEFVTFAKMVTCIFRLDLQGQNNTALGGTD